MIKLGGRGYMGRSGVRHTSLWNLDLREVDLGLVGDKIERAIRDAYTKYLLIDSRPRKVTLALPSTLPSPLLSTILDTIFTNFQAPNISLHSAPALTTVAAGLRAAVTVDIGWNETIVTGIYEFREVLSRRSIRATKLLGQEMRKLLAKSFDPKILQQGSPDGQTNVALEEFISFDECEEIVNRLAWCKPSANSTFKTIPESGLAPLQEEDELRASIRSLNISADTRSDAVATIPLRSTLPPRTLTLPFSKLAQPCWDPVQGKAVSQYRNNPKLTRPRRSSSSPTEIPSSPSDTLSSPVSPTAPRPPAHIPAGHRSPEPDSIASTINAKSGKNDTQEERGTVRAVSSMGAWSGASLLSQLKIPAVSSVDREVWMQHGMAGANRNAEVSVAAGAGGRSSMGPGAFKSGIGEKGSWTLGLWGHKLN
ncbi:hypothetical protein DID88_008638 [Monilinia fructigena]|uniref:Uncharacterized protein n=1 Tax=Monilinia fructigena TaxID=38457 RepID=A0A395J8E3_9HELO|nr:hypothetical protein DID88_008638 [Monilinia fructigena]